MTDLPKRALPRLLRSIRVPTPGLRARIDDIEGDLVSVSATGALVRMSRELPVGSTWPTLLDTETLRIALTGQVVRCESLPIELPGGATIQRPSFGVALVYSEASGQAMHALAELCGGHFKVEALPYRIMVLGEDPAINDVVTNVLLAAGYPVHVVHDAQRIAAATTQTTADAVIVNLGLDRQPSLWWMLETLAAHPTLGKQPMMALAQRASLTQQNRRYLAERRIRALSLPFTPEDLLTTLERAIRDPA